MKHVKIGKVKFGNDLPLALIAGPCALESEQHALDMSGKIKEITDELGIGFVYKTSFDKANRTSINSPRGIGLDQALPIFYNVQKVTGCPVITDIHDPSQVSKLRHVISAFQIPAFLCRQTDLLVAVAKTGMPMNVKKGQFLAPWDMKNVLKKITDAGNENVMLCERGASFGYNTLISDMRSLPIMAQTGYPVIFDATHSCQQPGGQGTTSGGQREFVPVLARAAVAVGVAGVFMEVHEDPDNAPSDGPNMIYLKHLKGILETLMEIDRIVK